MANLIRSRLRRLSPGRVSFFERLTPAVRASIIFPFIIIAAALSVLAWRSHQLSVRMEGGLTALAVQYLGYAAELTATRADAQMRDLMLEAAEDFRLLERSSGTADFTALQQWTLRHGWITSALYVPDDDPEETIFVREPSLDGNGSEELRAEFFSAEGAVEYTWDPDRVLEILRQTAVRTPEIHAPHLPEADELRQTSRIALVRRDETPNVGRAGRTMRVAVPLAPPLQDWAIRASVETTWAGTGWSSPRTLSLVISALAILVVMIGTYFALRGLARVAEANELRGALIANVSHELRTPLAMIRLGAETLKRGDRLPPAARDQMLDSILREVLHLHHLVENVLDVARLAERGLRPTFGSVNPADLVRSVVADYSAWFESKGFTVQTEIEDEVEEQRWDREAISRAVLNLIDNAIKYSRDDRVVTVGIHQRTDEIEIWVADRGVGIHPAEVTRIFDPYYRASFSDTESRRGAGLGLTLVRQIVEAHGGTIEIDSHPGIGSTFRLVFPRQVQQHAAGNERELNAERI